MRNHMSVMTFQIIDNSALGATVCSSSKQRKWHQSVSLKHVCSKFTMCVWEQQYVDWLIGSWREISDDSLIYGTDCKFKHLYDVMDGLAQVVDAYDAGMITYHIIWKQVIDSRPFKYMNICYAAPYLNDTISTSPHIAPYWRGTLFRRVMLKYLRPCDVPTSRKIACAVSRNGGYDICLQDYVVLWQYGEWLLAIQTFIWL